MSIRQDIEVELVGGTKASGFFAPRNEAALYACYIAKSSVLKSEDLKSLELLGHIIKEKK